MLILIGVFDLGFGIALAAASIEIGQVAGEVASSSELIRIGQTVSQITGGLLHLGQAEQGAAVKEVLDVIPPVWLTWLLSIGRVLLSLAAIVLGALLATRHRNCLPILGKWGLAAGGWGVLTMLMSIGTFRFIGITTGGLAATLTVLLDLTLHVAWPAVIVWKVRDAGIILINHASDSH
jgi:hypothetical protein